MIYYGILFDLTNLDDDEREILEFKIDGVSLHTGYSAGGYNPSMAILGYDIGGGSCLFNPRTLAEINKEATSYAPGDKVLIEVALAEFAISHPDIFKHAETTIPEVYIAEMSDD